MTLKQIQATEQIMRLAINGQNHVDSLIGYYRDTIDKFNEERIQWALYYEGCKENVKNKHLLEREIQNNHLKNLQIGDELAALKGQLTYQRQKYFYKTEENQRLKNNLTENRKRLEEIHEICKPLRGENSRVKSVGSAKTKAQFNNSTQELKSKKKEENLREQLELQLINIHRDHEQKKRNLQGTIDLLKDELQELVSEHSNRGNECAQQYKTILNKLSDLQSKHMNLISEFFKYRIDNVEQQQRIQEENEIIRLKNMAFVQKLKLLQQSHSMEFKTIDNQVKSKNKQFKQKYDQELKKKEQHLTILKEQHERISEIYLNKLKNLQSELRVATQKTRTIDQRTKIQVSSLKSQIKILSNRLENVGLNQMRNEIIENEEESEDDSSVTLEMEQLERINKQVKDLQRQLQKNTGVKN